jgi:hypothetical protein
MGERLRTQRLAMSGDKVRLLRAGPHTYFFAPLVCLGAAPAGMYPVNSAAVAIIQRTTFVQHISEL